jgi:hypothetical protein
MINELLIIIAILCLFFVLGLWAISIYFYITCVKLKELAKKLDNGNKM